MYTIISFLNQLRKCAFSCPAKSEFSHLAGIKERTAQMLFADLFSGIGGFRLGLTGEGFNCAFSSDIDPECRKTYAANFGETPFGDIRLADPAAIPDFDLLAAGFPCQPFSVSGKQQGFADDRGTLFFEICRFVAAKQPRVVFLENVKNLLHHDGGRTLVSILGKLHALGYEPAYKLLNAVDFGVPQSRERLIIVASKATAFDFAKVQTATRRILSDFLDDSSDSFFEYIDESEYTLIPNPKTQAKSGLRFVGYLNKNPRKSGIRPGTEHLSRSHKQPFRIYSTEGTHPTLNSQETSGRLWIQLPNGKVRKLTIDECYRVMGFPSSFIRISPKAAQYRQIGNSVCVPMVAAIARAISNQYF